MPAIITDKIRRSTTENYFNKFTEANDEGLLSSPSDSGKGVWIGIGRSQPWAGNETGANFIVPYPSSMPFDERLVRENLSALVRGSVHYLIPRNRLLEGRRYKKYDPTDWSCFYPSNAEDGSELLPCYVEFGGHVYLILNNNNGAQKGVGNPSLSSYGTQTVDGYRYAYVTSVPAGSTFFTNQFIEIPDDNPAGAKSGDQLGLIFGYRAVSRGTGYTNSDTATIRGLNLNGTVRPPENVSITTTTGGQIQSIALPTSGAPGWLKATVTINSGTGSGAHFVPLIGPAQGFGENIREHLPAWFLGVAADFEGKVEGAAKIIPFRQISVILNPERNPAAESGDSPGLVNARDAMDALNYFVLNSLPLPNEIPTTGSVITQTSSGARAYFDRYREVDSEHRFYFHNSSFSSNVNILPFDASGNISISNVSYVYTSLSSPEYVHGTGDVLFIENRNRIDRSVSQTEEVKVVIQY